MREYPNPSRRNEGNDGPMIIFPSGEETGNQHIYVSMYANTFSKKMFTEWRICISCKKLSAYLCFTCSFKDPINTVACHCLKECIHIHEPAIISDNEQE